MKAFYLIIFVTGMLSCFSISAEPIQLESAFSLGGELYDSADAVAVDKDGSVYIAINTERRIFDLGGGRQVIAPECQFVQVGNFDCRPSPIRNILVIKLSLLGHTVYSTFLGGTGRDQAFDLALDDDGNVYIVGETSARDFPINRSVTRPLSQSFQTAFAGGDTDAFVVKLNSDGDIVATSLFGGNGDDRINGVVVDDAGRVAITGETNSRNLPTKQVFHLPNVSVSSDYNGGGKDGFVAVMSSQLNNLLWSQFVGGTGSDSISDIAYSDDNLWLTGVTDSPRLNTNSTTNLSSFSGGRSDALIASFFTPFGSQRLLSYWGGQSEDSGRSITVDSSDKIIVAGTTSSTDFPTSPTAFSNGLSGKKDGFVSRFELNAGQLQLIQSSYIGGTEDDQITSVSTNPKNQIVIVGQTQSNNFPITPDASQIQINSTPDAFMLSFDRELKAIDYSTFFGGNGVDLAHSSATDRNDIIYLVGRTNSDDLPLPNHILPWQGGSDRNAYFAKWTPTGLLPLDLQIDLSATPDPVNPTDILTYTIKVTNDNTGVSNDASDIVVIDKLPIGTTFVSASSSGSNCIAELTTHTVKCRRSFLRKGENFSIQIQIIPHLDDRTIKNFAEVTSSDTDHSPNNNKATLHTQVTPFLKLQLQRTGEITQGIQDLGNHVSLVEHKNTVVRVFPEAHRGSNSVSATDLTGRLFGFRNGQPLPDSPLSPDNGSVSLSDTGQDRSDSSLSFNYTLPFSWTSGKIELSASLSTKSDGTGEVDRVERLRMAGRNSSTNSLVQSSTIRFWKVAPICMRTYRVRTASGELERGYLLNNEDGQNMLTLATDLLPTHRINVFPRDTILVNRLPLPYFTSNTDLDSASILSALWSQDVFSNDPDSCDDENARTHYVAIVNTQDATRGGTATYGDQLWFDADPDDSNANPQNPDDPNNGSHVSRSRINDPRGGRSLAHELGHNYSRKHVSCACGSGDLPASPDTRYPFNSCSIGNAGANEFFGFNTRTMTPIGPQMNDDNGRAISDLMSYSCTRWPSSYFWTRTFSKLRCQFQDTCSIPDAEVMAIASGADPLPTISPITIANSQPSQPKVILGTVVLDLKQSKILTQDWQVLSTDWLPANKLAKNFNLLGGSDDPQLTVFDNNGNKLSSHGLASLPMADHAKDSSLELLAFQIPVSEQARGFSINFKGINLATFKASNTSPKLTIDSPVIGDHSTGILEAKWTASDPDNGDKLKFTILYSRDNGKTWELLERGLKDNSVQLDLTSLGGNTTNARIRVLASDGFHTAEATSPKFTVDNQPPTSAISRPVDGAVFQQGQSIIAEGTGYDPEDGYNNNDQLKWFLNGQALHSSAPRIKLGALDPGTYRLKLTTIDSSGLEGTVVHKFSVIAGIDLNQSDTGMFGRVFTHLANGTIGGAISGVRIQFISEDQSVNKTIISGTNGTYRLGLPSGRYVVTAEHNGFRPFSSAPGFMIVRDGRFGTGNIFLKR